jgi:hypothetical protein
VLVRQERQSIRALGTASLPGANSGIIVTSGPLPAVGAGEDYSDLRRPIAYWA